VGFLGTVASIISSDRRESARIGFVGWRFRWHCDPVERVRDALIPLGDAGW
jgi:hypothetical protein